MYWIASPLFFSIISSPIFNDVVKETSFTNIDESVQIIEYLNKLPAKSPLHKANEFQVLEPLLVAMILDIWNHFYNFSWYYFCFINVST